MFGAENMALMFYRIDCKEITADWSNEQKITLAKKMSNVTLDDPKFWPGESREVWSFPEVPNRKFSALKIIAWMEELLKSTNGLDVNPEVSKMVNAISGE